MTLAVPSDFRWDDQVGARIVQVSRISSLLFFVRLFKVMYVEIGSWLVYVTFHHNVLGAMISDGDLFSANYIGIYIF